jgi:acetyl-CoA carboxylase carboxyltransferase component
LLASRGDGALCRHPRKVRRARRHELKSIGADIGNTWLSAEIAVGPGRREHHLPARDQGLRILPRQAELVQEYTERFSNPYQAAERGYVDDVIDPRDTRKMLVQAFAMLRTKREQLPSRKHGNSPL